MEAGLRSLGVPSGAPTRAPSDEAPVAWAVDAAPSSLLPSNSMAKSKKKRSAASGDAKPRSKRRRATPAPNRLPWVIGIVAVVALIAVPIVLEAVRAGNLPGERFASQGNRHVALGAEVAPYNSNPPTSGPHNAQLAAWGVYGPEDATPHDQELLHNMEDGGVVLWYRPADDPAETDRRIAGLEEVAEGYRRVAIVPRSEMPTTFALTAWQRLQRFDELEPQAMRTFVEAYEGVDNHAR